MRLTNCLALFAGVVSAFGELDVTDEFDALDNTIEARALKCVKGVHVVGLGGQGTTNGDLGYLAPLADGIVNAIPDSNLFQIGYPVGALGPQDIPYAMPRLHRHIKNYAAKCPHTKMVLASYSVGAAVTMNTLCGSAQNGTDPSPLAAHYRHNIVASVVYGDLTFIPGRPYNYGTCKHKSGLVPRQKPHLCFPFGKKTRSYCDHGDVNCCSGHNQAVHFEYPQKYDQNALDFVMRRWHMHLRLEKEKKHHHKGKKHHN